MDRDLTAVDQVFKALADPTRVRILGLLGGGETCVCHIHESLRLPQSLVSRHLAYLRRAGLVEARKQGLWVHYRLARRDDVTPALLEAIYQCVGKLPAVGKDVKRLRGRAPIPEPRGPEACCE